ncbi:unnamed protein product [Adineta steineri]|uniref:Uncharacterized protein n=1 Tax=Adineta steineri TaxID=433720 RepID=A0A820FXC2_9BILA|nr:unnamed protein product [Adineta steineri]CAF1195834.1 unnamed protein product [Adineta steineri]CAF3534756.1 unnamed protein product [Adineta steineri]CAF4268518.1 unnamed protein product [Adineta steineri]
MVICNQQIIIILLIIISLIVFICTLYEISLNNQRKLLITIVDYRWNPLVNMPVQFETTDEYYEEYYTNKQGQILFYVNDNLNDTELIHILVSGINEKISLLDKEVTVRLSTINRDTGESYDDDIFS